MDIRKPGHSLVVIHTGAGFVAEGAGAVARTMATPPLTFDPNAGTVTSFAEERMKVLCLRTGACLFDRATQVSCLALTSHDPIRILAFA